LNEFTANGLEPDVTILLDINPLIAIVLEVFWWVTNPMMLWGYWTGIVVFLTLIPIILLQINNYFKERDSFFIILAIGFSTSILIMVGYTLGLMELAGYATIVYYLVFSILLASYSHSFIRYVHIIFILLSPLSFLNYAKSTIFWYVTVPWILAIYLTIIYYALRRGRIIFSIGALLMMVGMAGPDIFTILTQKAAHDVYLYNLSGGLIFDQIGVMGGILLALGSI
ncbi:MAG: hypothetical protein QMD12_02380, partial [Candidatus Aenigmarchaeota archaeon]|nr:hypothetical protein [Candidatus Aenigmarchaeota archaeon]